MSLNMLLNLHYALFVKNYLVVYNSTCVNLSRLIAANSYAYLNKYMFHLDLFN